MKKRATARDVANLAGVSRTTVSFVLNEVTGMRIKPETRERVFEAARTLDYHPDATAQRMVSGRTRVIGFVLPQTPDQVFADRFLPQVLNGLTHAALANGYHLLLEPAPPSEIPHAYVRLVREHQVDGIILSGPRSDDRELPALHSEGTPVVLMGQLPGTGIPFVDIDNVGGATKAVDHLVTLGHRRIGMITNAPLEYTASADRLAGYRNALEAAAIAFDQHLVRQGDFTPQGGEHALCSLLDVLPRVTAVFIASDTVALGALRAARRLKLNIPGDLALVGFDDIPMSEFVEPPLTTISLPAYGLGWGAMDLLVRLIESPDDVRETAILLETELVVRRSSTAEPPFPT